jgi:adenylate cyclase
MLSIQYAAGLAFAHLLAVADAAAIVIPLHDRIGTGAYAYFSGKNMVIAGALTVLGALAVAVGGAVILAPALRWFVGGQQPDEGRLRRKCGSHDQPPAYTANDPANPDCGQPRL